MALATFILFHGETADPLRISDLCAGREREWSVKVGEERGESTNAEKKRKEKKRERGGMKGKSNARRVCPVCNRRRVCIYARAKLATGRGCLRVARGCFRKLEPNTYTAKGLTERVSPAIVITHIEGVTPTGQWKGSEGERGRPVTSNSRTQPHTDASISFAGCCTLPSRPVSRPPLPAPRCPFSTLTTEL